MRGKKWELCAFLMFDYKAVQVLLNRRAGEGWAFAGMRLGLLARYARCAPGEYRYFLDWCDPLKGDEGYLELCADAGWELMWEQGYLRFFRSRPGEEPAPIQTDGALEYQRFRKKALRRMVLSGVLFPHPGLLLPVPRAQGGVPPPGPPAAHLPGRAVGRA